MSKLRYPLEVEAFGLYDANNVLVADFGYSDDYFTNNEMKANAVRATECLNALKNSENPKEWVKEAVSIKGTMVELCGLLGVETPQQAYDKVKRLMHPETCDVIVE